MDERSLVERQSANMAEALGLHVTTAWESLRSRAALKDVERLVFFVGYPRSGHSLIGSLMSAHPEIAISHELDVFRYFRGGFSRTQLMAMMLRRDRWFSKRGRDWTGYNYEVPNQYQGRYTKLRVLGDKKGMGTAVRIQADPDLIQKIHDRFKLPVRWFHHVRNPMDNISTIWNKGRPRHDLGSVIEFYFQLCEGVQHVIDREPGEHVLTEHHESFVADSKDSLTRMCGHAGVQVTEDYLNDCVSLLFDKPRRTASVAPWTQELVDQVNRGVERFAWLHRYAPLALPEPDEDEPQPDPAASAAGA